MKTVLEEANEIIYGPRRASYGNPWDNFLLTASLWEPVLGVRVTPEQVAMCMIQLKLARELHVHKRDNLVDVAGYCGTLYEVAEERARRNKETLDDLTRLGQGLQGRGVVCHSGKQGHEETPDKVEGSSI